MPRWNQVLIDGVGLIGGSVGMALRRRGLASQVIGAGRNEQALVEARRLGAIDDHIVVAQPDAATLNPSDLATLKSVEIVVVCTPTPTIAERVAFWGEVVSDAALLTDAGSTKEAVCRDVARRDVPRFVGAHPLAGGHRSGAAAGNADLFDGKVVVLTPAAGLDSDVLARATEFWSSLGGVVQTMTPQAHDQQLAATSHAPHVVAAALAAATPESSLPLTASGWRDATRIAAADAELWTGILRANRIHCLSALDNFAKVLASLRNALEEDDAEKLAHWLSRGKKHRDAVAS